MIAGGFSGDDPSGEPGIGQVQRLHGRVSEREERRFVPLQGGAGVQEPGPEIRLSGAERVDAVARVCCRDKVDASNQV